MQAIIYKSTGSWYVAKTMQHQFYKARIKGAFKKENFTSSNPIAVGDIVEIEPENESGHTAIITKIYDRKNYISRSSPRVPVKQHIIAANIHQALLLVTLKQPKTTQGFIDRFLITAEAYEIAVIIAFNKIDLYKEAELQQLQTWQEMYEQAGYHVIQMSLLAQPEKALHTLKPLLHSKISLISGHSGVGKSSLLNILVPNANFRVQEVSHFSGKGMHTTTFAEMFDLPFGGSIIDTPGIKEFGLVDVLPEELPHYFPEIKALTGKCRFHNCLHVNEPECAVKEAVAKNHLSAQRYESYLQILRTITNKER
jgi:ribosome biogenesis GTPase